MPSANAKKENRVLAKSGPKSIAAWLLSHLSRETSSGRFIPEMDGLRFVAIALVFLFHLNGYLVVKSGSFYTFREGDVFQQVAGVGFRGVEFFFAISGFILGLPFAAHHINRAKKVNLRKYYLRRLTRLEPPYVVTMLILVAIGILFQGYRFQDVYRHAAAGLLYQHDVIYGTMNPAMGIAWSLEIEVQFYLLVPLLTLLFAIKPVIWRRSCMLAIMAAILVLQPWFLPQHPRLSLSILAYLQFFLVGFLLADIFLADWKQMPRRSYYWDLVALAGWPLLFIVLHSAVAQHWLFPFFVLFLYVAAFRGSLCNLFFANPWITAIGGMCYSIYLIHYQLISAVARFTKGWSEGMHYWIHLLVQSAIVGSATLTVCGFYFLLLEKPCMRADWPQRLWSRLSGKRDSVRSAAH